MITVLPLSCCSFIARVRSDPSGRMVIHWSKDLGHKQSTPACPLGLYSGEIGFLSSTHLIAYEVEGNSSCRPLVWKLYSQCSWMHIIEFWYFLWSS